MILHKNIKHYGIHFLNSIYINHLFNLNIKTNLFRFKNGTPEVQLACIKHLKSYFVNHPELTSDLEGLI